MSEWSNVHESQVNTRLEKLEPSRLARYNSGLSDAIGRRACTEDTRLDILAEIGMWCDDPKSPMIYWMDGMAGTGKTTIAYSLAKRLESCHRLGASFFCTVTSEECRKAGKIIPTIAYQLSQQSTPFKAVLGAVLKDDPDAPVLSIPEQMKRLLVDPLNGVKDSMARNLIVVIDALDECYDGNVVRLILSSLVSSAEQLPLKFFITSRPEPAIFDQMSTRPDNIRSVLRLHEVSQDAVQRDIRTYLKDGLQSISPSEDELDRLTILSERLFIYAATTVRYIIPENASVNSHARMKTMLDINSKSTKRYSGIDTLYSSILSGAINNDDLEPEERDSILSVVWSIVCSDHPVSLAGLVVIAGLGCETAALAALAPLRSVLHVSPTNDTISSFHASFPQFILDRSRSKIFSCNTPHIRQSSTIRCLKTIHTQLPCPIQPDMVVSPHLAYASENWILHLVRGSCGTDEALDELYTELRRFFEERFESWIWLIHDRPKTQLNHQMVTTNSQPTKPVLGTRYRVRYRTRMNQSLIERLDRWLRQVNGPADLRQASRNAADYIAFSTENRKLIRDEALRNHPLVARGLTGASYRSWIWGEVDYSTINFHFPES